MSTLVSPSPPAALVRLQEVRRRGALSALAIQPLHLVSLFVCVLFFCGWLAVEQVALPIRAVLFFALLVLNVYYFGRLLLHALSLDGSPMRSFALIFLTGSLSWALLMLALHSLLPGSLPCHMLILLSLSTAGQYLIYRGENPPREERGAAWLSLFVVFFSLAAAACWARGLLGSMQPHEEQVEFHHWTDYFDHAAVTSQLRASEHLWSFGNFQIGHLPTPLYHYGSYLFSACLADFGSLSSYTVVVAFWTPFGTFLSGLAAYVLAVSFGGRVAGLCGLIALLALPDASYYGFRNPWFRYHWLQQIGSAGLYGVACAALAFLFLVEARRSRSWLSLTAGLAFGSATFFFKAQIFVVLTPFLVAWLILCYSTFSVAWRILLLQAAIVAGLSGLVICHKLHLGPHITLPDRQYFEEYCKYAAAEGRAGPLRTTVAKGAAALGRSRYYLAATASVVLFTFGALIGFVPLLSLWAWWKKKAQAADLAPWLVVALYAILLVGLKDDFVGVHKWELLHRPFVWAYFVLTVWCAGKCCVLLRATRLGPWLLNPHWIAVVGLLLLVLPWQMGRHVQEGRMSWRSGFYGRRFPRGLVECGRYVARNSPRSDLVQDGQYDEFLVFGSLSERRSYLSRPKLWKMAKNLAIRGEVVRRVACLEQFKTATTAEQIRQAAAQMGLRWYLLHPEDRVAWPKEFLAKPAFRCDGFAVYDLEAVTF